MRKIFFYSCLVLSLLTSPAHSQLPKPKPPVPKNAAIDASVKIQSIEVPFVNKTLPNGLEVIVLPDPSIPLVTVELDVRNGSFTEPPEFHGLSHLYEHMFFKENLAIRLGGCENGRVTASFSNPYCTDLFKLKPKIGDTAYLKDADQMTFYNGSTREEVVNYFYTTTSPYLGTAIRFINDSVRFPAFDESDLESEKRIVIGEIDRQEANPYQLLDLTMKEKLFYKYPTRKNPQGTRESVNSATTDKMRTIKSRYYVPNNAALIITGDVKADEAFRLAEQIMGSWERKPVDPFKEFPLVEHPPLVKSEGLIIDKKISEESSDGGQNVIISIGWHGPSIGKDDAATYAADVFSYIISQPDSRFQRNLVDSGLATSVGFGYYTQRNVGPIGLILTTTPEKAKAALTAVYAEIAQFSQPDYFTDEELESAKTILESNDLFEREKLSNYTHTLGFWWSSTGIEYFRGYYKNLRAVSRAETNRYVKTYIQGKPHVSLSMMSPEAKQKANLTEQDLIGK